MVDCTNKNLEIVHISVEKNIVNSGMYFEQYLSENQQYTTMLKVYLKETDKKNTNYIILETFGFQFQNIETIMQGIPQTSELGSSPLYQMNQLFPLETKVLSNNI